MRALRHRVEEDSAGPAPPPEWTRAIAIEVRTFATIFDVHMPRQLNGLPTNSLRFATGNFQQHLKENCCDTDPKRISSVRDDQHRHMGAQCLEHFEGFKHNRGRKASRKNSGCHLRSRWRRDEPSVPASTVPLTAQGVRFHTRASARLAALVSAELLRR